jgi:hypothetical protein
MVAQTAASTTANNAGATAFRCPESFSTEAEKEAAVRSFMDDYRSAHPDKTVRDLMIDRYRALVEHDCSQTLAYMTAHISPIAEEVRFDSRDFLHDTTEFDPATRVWTVYFDPVSPSDQEHVDELVLNLYGWNPAPLPTDIAKAFVSPRQNIIILSTFAAPDNGSKDLFYYVVSLNMIPSRSYGYVNLTRIGPVAGSAFAVTYGRKFQAHSADELLAKAKAWLLSDTGKAIQKEVSQVGVNSDWQTALAGRSQ